jgi:hypothetical protein
MGAIWDQWWRSYQKKNSGSNLKNFEFYHNHKRIQLEPEARQDVLSYFCPSKTRRNSNKKKQGKGQDHFHPKSDFLNIFNIKWPFSTKNFAPGRYFLAKTSRIQQKKFRKNNARGTKAIFGENLFKKIIRKDVFGLPRKFFLGMPLLVKFGQDK